MKIATLLLLSAFTLLAQPMPFYLQGKRQVDVYGTVVSVSANQIVVSNMVSTLSGGGNQSVIYRTRRGIGHTVVTAPLVIQHLPTYTYLRGYPRWREVRRGDKVAMSKDFCYLLSQAGGYRTVEYWKGPPKKAVKVWH